MIIFWNFLMPINYFLNKILLLFNKVGNNHQLKSGKEVKPLLIIRLKTIFKGNILKITILLIINETYNTLKNLFII